MSTSIFAAAADENPTTVIRKTMSVALDDDGTPVVSFATNRGKGTGAQTMPVAEFREYVETISEFFDSGIPEQTPDERLSAAETVRRTIAVDDGIISFRTRSGKGAKPAKFAADELGNVVELLTSTIEAVENAGASLVPAGE